MKVQKKLEIMLVSEFLVLGVLTAFMVFWGFEGSERYFLYEIFGAILATMVTTYGIYKIGRLT